MPSDTPNHNLNRPDTDSTGWGGDVNSNFADIDTDLILKDTKANRPSAGTTDRWFLATDENILYYDDGTSWNEVGGLGASGSPTSSTAYRTAIDTERLSTDAVTMYVDPSGDDGNDGLSASSPKQHINAAIQDAPVHPQGTTPLIIDLAAGTYTVDTGESNVANLDRPYLGTIKFVGATDGAGDPSAVIDAEANNTAIEAYVVDVIVENVELKGGATPIQTIRASVDFTNVHVTGTADSDRCAYFQNLSRFSDDSDCVYDATTISGGDWNISLTGNCAGSISGTVTGTGGGGRAAVSGKEGSWVFIRDSAVIDGNSEGSPCFRIGNLVDLKIGSPEIKDGSPGILAESLSNLRIPGTPTWTNIASGDRYKISRGSFAENDQSERVLSLPFNGSTPTSYPVGSSTDSGLVHYSQTTELVEYYSNERDAWLESGREVLRDTTGTVPGGGAAAFTITGAQAGDLLDWAIGPESTPGGAQFDAWLRTTSGGDIELRIEEKAGISGDVNVSFRVWRV